MFANRYRYIYVLLLAIYSYLNILFTEGNRLFSTEISPSLLFLSVLFIVLLVWEANHLLFNVVERNQNRFPKKVHLLIAFFVLSLIHVLIIAVLFGAVVPGLLGVETTNIVSQIKLSAAFAFRINLFLHTLHAIIYINQKLRHSRIEAEHLKTLHAESQFEALRNQLNPHFLFNSFSVLSGLVHKDPVLASDFIQQLSKVYRYLLYNNQQKLVPLPNETAFLDAFTFLLKIRFDDSLIFIKKIGYNEMDNFWIPSASTQLLVENAVKHNIVSKKFPLQIDIFIENEFLVVKNNLQPKPQLEISGGLGLNNIQQRYQHMTSQSVIIQKTDQDFVVKLPLFKRPTL